MKFTQRCVIENTIANTIWYFQFHFVCDKLPLSFAINGSPPCFCCGCQTCSHYSKGGASCILSFSLSPALLVVFFCAEATSEKAPFSRSFFMEFRYHWKVIRWRCHPDSDRGIKVLQTFALPLGYGTEVWSGRRDSDPRHPPWQGGTLPLSYYRTLWCLGAESNHRHVDFQSTALPTELPRHNGDQEGSRTLDLQRDRLAL